MKVEREKKKRFCFLIDKILREDNKQFFEF